MISFQRHRAAAREAASGFNLRRDVAEKVRARMQIICNGSVVAKKTFVRRQAKGMLDVQNLGPGDCDARLTNTTGVSLKYTLKVQLAVAGETAGG